MTKTQHKRTAVTSMFQNGISQNTKSAERDGFCRLGHYLLELCFSSENCKHGMRAGRLLPLSIIAIISV